MLGISIPAPFLNYIAVALHLTHVLWDGACHSWMCYGAQLKSLESCILECHEGHIRDDVLNINIHPPHTAMGVVVTRPSGLDDKPSVFYGAFVYDPGNVTYSKNLPPIPIEWIIAPLNATATQCPTSAATLRTFGVTNAVVVVLAIITGCRPLVQKLTRGLLGSRGGSSVKYMWMLSLAPQLLANLSLSLLITKTPGYGHLSLLNVFALYSARPRVSLIMLALLRVCMGVNLHIFCKSSKYRRD